MSKGRIFRCKKCGRVILRYSGKYSVPLPEDICISCYEKQKLKKKYLDKPSEKISQIICMNCRWLEDCIDKDQAPPHYNYCPHYQEREITPKCSQGTLAK